MPDLVFHFLRVNLRSSLSLPIPQQECVPGEALGAIPHLFLGVALACSLPPSISLYFTDMNGAFMMSQVMKDPSSVINIFPGLGIVCGFNYHSGAHLLFRWHVPAKWRFIPSTLHVSAHQLCRWQQLHIYVF